jgi:hypothetical protein
MPSRPTHAALQRAVDTANAQIRGFWKRVGDRLPDAGEWVEHERLTAEWNRAVTALAAAREGEDEPAAVLVLTA